MKKILLVLLLFSCKAEAAITVVHTATTHNAGASVNVVNITSSTSGNLLAAICVGNKIGGGQPAISTIIDSASQNWVAATAAKSSETTRFYTTEIWLFKNTTSGVTSVTATWSAAQSDTDCWVLEIAGASTTSPQDGNGQVLSNQTTANPNIPNITTTNANDILIGGGQEQHGMSGGGNNGWTLLSIDGVPNDYSGFASYKILSATCSPCTGDTYTAVSGAWITSVVAFGDNSGGGGGSSKSPCSNLRLLGVGCVG